MTVNMEYFKRMQSTPTIPSPHREALAFGQPIADAKTASDDFWAKTKTQSDCPRLVAADPTTSPEILQQLSHSFDPLTRQAIAANPNTPTEVLWKLGIEFPEQLLDNPIFSLLQLETPDLIERIPRATRISLLKCEKVPLNFLQWAWKHCRWEEEIFIALAINPKTAKQILKRLDRTTRGMRRSMGHHPHIPSYILELFAQDLDSKIRESVAINPKTPTPVLRVLATDDYHQVRINVASNSSTTTDILEKLARDEDVDVLHQVATHPQTSAQILEQFATHPDDWVRRCTASHFQTPSEVLSALSNDSDDWVRQNIASNPQTPTWVLHKLVGDADLWVRENLTANPNTPLEALQQLALDPDERVRQLATYRLDQTRTNPIEHEPT